MKRVQEIALEIIKTSTEVHFLEKEYESSSREGLRELYILRLVQGKVKLVELVEELKKSLL